MVHIGRVIKEKKKQMELVAGTNATSLFENSYFCFSTPSLNAVMRHIMALGYIVTLLLMGSSRMIALTVAGAKCLNRLTLASPFPLRTATQSIFDTDKARHCSLEVHQICGTHLFIAFSPIKIPDLG